MTCEGPVKSFNAAKGYGFISYDGQDVFTHIKDCGAGVPQTGDTVTFDMEESSSKPGTFVARNVVGGTGTMPEPSNGKGKGKAPAQGTGQFFGTVKSYNDQKAWGFVLHEGQDVFFHLKDMADGSAPRAGDQVQFDLEDNPAKPGSMKAKNVTGGTSWPQQQKGKDKGKGKGDYGAAYGGGGGYGGGGYGMGPYGGDGYGKGGGYGKGDGYGGGGYGKGGGMDWGKGGGDWGKGGGMDWGKGGGGGWGKGGGDAWGKGGGGMDYGYGGGGGGWGKGGKDMGKGKW